MAVSLIMCISGPKIVIATTAQCFCSTKHIISYAETVLGMRLALVEVDFDDMAGLRNVEVKDSLTRKSLIHIIIAIIIISRINVIITLSYCCSPPKDFLLLSGIVRTSSGISLLGVDDYYLVVACFFFVKIVVTRRGNYRT